MAGGLHGFTGKAELHAEFPTNPYVEAEVYCKLTDEQALRLALQHNVNGHFIHKMTFRDIVSHKPTDIFDAWRTHAQVVAQHTHTHTHIASMLAMAMHTVASLSSGLYISII